MAGEGTSGPRDIEDELLSTIETHKGQSDIVADGMRIKEGALRQRQIKQQRAMGLCGTDAIQDDETLSLELEEYIDMGGDLDKEIVVVDGDEKEVQRPNGLISKEMVPDQGTQQSEPPTQTSQIFHQQSTT